ncbi:MAG: transketolase, partial [bacterium]
GMGWEVLKIDGHDHTQIRRSLDRADQDREKPLLIIGRTVMAHGAYSMEGSEDTHGSPLPAQERAKTKEKLGLAAEAFVLPPESYTHFRARFDQKRARAQTWKQ